MRRSDFSGAKLNGAYFIKAVCFRSNFQGADLSDALMDRAVLTEANLRDAVLTRAVFTRSDFEGADITGADFSFALVDRDATLKLCRRAEGTNPTTGVDTAQSLGCGNRRRRFQDTPSSPDAPKVSEAEKENFRASLPVYFE